MRQVWMRILCVLAIAATVGAELQAQGYPGAGYRPGWMQQQSMAQYGQPPAYGAAPVQQLGPGAFRQAAPMPMQGQPMPMQGQPMPMHAQHMPGQPMPMQGQLMPGQAMPGQPMQQAAFMGQGVPNHSRVGGRLSNATNYLANRMSPYGEGGYCAPRWYDINIGTSFMSRDGVGRGVGLASDGIAGPIVLGTDDLAFDEEGSLLFDAAIQLQGGNVLEFGYHGLGNWATSKSVESNGNLYSVLSNFGTAPFGGFGETDAANLHRMAYSTSFDSVELSLRRRWTGPNCRYQGSFLMGARYIYLLEDFLYHTSSNNGSMDFAASTVNSMPGLQVGGDLWIAVAPGLSVGIDGKFGVLYNGTEARNVYTATSIPAPGLVTDDDDGRAAFMLDAKLLATWKLNENLTFRAGYQWLYLDGVALAAEQFNPNPPFIAPQPPLTVYNSGDVLYQGFTASFEWMW